MASVDFTPLLRTSIGFDRLPHLLAQAARIREADQTYPPYNIEKLGPDDYRIVIALAGFEPDDLELVQHQNRLTVRGKAREAEDSRYLYRGITGRSFERHFNLADFVRVTGASLENGLLSIELKHEVPERLKPRKIEIATQKPARPRSEMRPHTVSNDNRKQVA